MDFEVVEWAERADRFLEQSPRLVLARWRRHLLRHRFDVALPPLDDLSLRPLFVSHAFASEVLEVATANLDVGRVAMPGAVGLPDSFVITEPPHGREWLAQAAYVDLAVSPWLDRLGLEPESVVAPLVTALVKAANGGVVALALSDAEQRSLEDVDVRVLQLLWHLEARLRSAGASPMILEASRLGDADIDAVAWWSVPAFDTPVPSFPATALTRRALPRLATLPGYAPIGTEGDFKPFDDAWAVVPRHEVQSASEGVFQAQPARPVVQLPFFAKGSIRWEACPVELNVIGLDGEVLGAFGRCTREAKDGAYDFICPAVVVR